MDKFNISFTQTQLQILNMALGEIPHKFAGPLVQHINECITAAKTPDPAIPTLNETVPA